MDEHERLMNVALEVADETLSDYDFVHWRVSRIYVVGVLEHVLVICVSDIVGWLRIKDGKFVWRDGNFDTREAYAPVPVENPEVDPWELRDAIGDFFVHADESRWPPPESADGEAEEFVRSIENGQRPPAWSQGRETVQPTPSSPPAPPATANADPPALRAAPAPAPHSLPVKFNASIHTRERNPAAAGFTEKDLNDVPLITVYPAAIPASIGAAFLALGFMGGEYEFYVVLRWAVTSMAIWMSVVAGGQSRNWWSVAFAGVAVLFNPLIPVTATREFWVYPDFVGTVLFAVAGRKLRASRPATHSD